MFSCRMDRFQMANDRKKASEIRNWRRSTPQCLTRNQRAPKIDSFSSAKAQKIQTDNARLELPKRRGIPKPSRRNANDGWWQIPLPLRNHEMHQNSTNTKAWHVIQVERKGSWNPIDRIEPAGFLAWGLCPPFWLADWPPRTNLVTKWKLSERKKELFCGRRRRMEDCHKQFLYPRCFFLLWRVGFLRVREEARKRGDRRAEDARGRN